MGYRKNDRPRAFAKQLSKLLLASIMAVTLCLPALPAFAAGQSLPGGGTVAAQGGSDISDADNDVNFNDDTYRTVWVSRSGSKYHYSPTCSGMKNPTAMTLAQAIAAGKTPCSKCVTDGPDADAHAGSGPDA